MGTLLITEPTGRAAAKTTVYYYPQARLHILSIPSCSLLKKTEVAISCPKCISSGFRDPVGAAMDGTE